MKIPYKPSGPLADPTRAAEIALMDELGLTEFIELTGVAVGDYGNYKISASGVSLLLVAEAKQTDLSKWTAEEQLVLLRAARAPALSFPCSPEDFMSWYDTTRGADPGGKPGTSDFPLVEAFEKAIRRRGGVSGSSKRFSCPSPDIAAAFAVRPDPAKNAAWWSTRLSDPRKYGKLSLVQARQSPGNPKNPSRWYPDVVAAWLIETGHLPLPAVVQAMKRSFSAVEFDPVIPDD